MLKKIFKNKQILINMIISISILIMIAGTLTIVFKGLNYNLMYDKNNQVEIYFDKTIEEKDLNKLLDTVFGKQKTIVQKLNGSEKYLLITTKNLTNKQKEILVQKFNEINIENKITINDLVIYENEKINLIENYKKYLLPITISLFFVTTYLITKYNRIGKIKIIYYILGSIITIQYLYLSIIAITRIPINFITIPISLMILFINIFILSVFFENIKEKEILNNKNKTI